MSNIHTNYISMVDYYLIACVALSVSWLATKKKNSAKMWSITFTVLLTPTERKLLKEKSSNRRKQIQHGRIYMWTTISLSSLIFLLLRAFHLSFEIYCATMSKNHMLDLWITGKFFSSSIFGTLARIRLYRRHEVLLLLLCLIQLLINSPT